LATCLIPAATETSSAQTVVRVAAAVAPLPPRVAGGIRGVVRDERGQAVVGASIIAMGQMVVTARSDGDGRFLLEVAPGDYILRATRAGFVSHFREAVRVPSSRLIDRDIRLVRQDADASLLAAVPPGDHAHTEAAWRLRHLPRVVLRDGYAALEMVEETAPARPRLTWFDWAIERSAQAAAFFTQTDFSGQLNVVTTSAAPAGARWLPFGGPRGIAYVSVGAPLRSHGQWRVRGTIATGDRSSWAVLGEYVGSPLASHAFTLGGSFSAQGFTARSGGARGVQGADARSVGAIYGGDRWRLPGGALLDYGLRIDRYDYATPHDLLSPRAGVRLPSGLLPRTFVRAATAQRMTAPGAAEFLPPASAGLWLPPERSFSSLVRDAPLLVARLRHHELAIEHEFGPPSATTVFSVVRFRQDVHNQGSTLFRFGEANGAGHYQVATPGAVEVDGWILRLSGRLGRRLRGAIDYATTVARWAPGDQWRALSYRVPSAARRGDEQLHDLTARLDTEIAETSTRLTVSYRFNTGYSRVRWRGREAAAGRRFAIQLHQALPYQPLEDGRLEAVFALRTLYRDLDDLRGFYDELLTVAPPLRVMGGVQVKF
jgi:hypothetical protein